MALDGITIAALTYELNNRITGGRISKITQPESDEIMLTIKTNNAQERVLISAGASLPFCYLTDINLPSPMTAPSFCMLLRKHISGGHIISVTQPGLERIIDITIEHLDEMGDTCRKILTVELMGKHSNIIFRTPEGKIIDSIKHISALVSSVREVLPGKTYFIPKADEKLDPLTMSEEEFINALKSRPMPISKAIYTSVTGLSPVIAEEICLRSNIAGDVPASDTDPDLLTHLSNNLTWLIDEVKEHDFTPNIILDDGVPIEFAPIKLNQYRDMNIEYYDTMSQLLHIYYERRNVYAHIRQKSADLRKIVQTSLERNLKKYDIQSKQLADTDKMDKYRIYGELLQTYGYGVAEGSKEITVDNYYTGSPLTIPLDPTSTPMADAQKYFARYAKLKRTKEAVTVQIEETNAEIEHLESIATALDIATAEEDLAQIKDELIESGYIKKHSQDKRKAARKSKPLHYISSDGIDMYVGKNNFQNDELTFKKAEGGDWWFHAKKIPGSHVIACTKGRELPDATCEEAARLAAFYSKGRSMGKVEIDYVIRKEVKKPAKAKPGFVVYYTNYSMVASADIAGIKESEQ